MGFFSRAKSGVGAARTFKSWFTYRLIIVLFILLIINSVIVGIQERSIEPVILDLGQTFFGSTEKIRSIGEEVIANKGIYDEKEGLLVGGFNVIWILIQLFSSVITLILWIITLITVFAWSFISDDSNKFANLVLSLTAFYLIQLIYIFYMGNIEGNILNILYHPIESFVIFFQAVPYIVQPISSTIETISDPFKNSTNNTIEPTNLTNVTF